MTLVIKLPGWDEYHETHTHMLIENGGVLWIPKELPGTPAVSFAQDTTGWTEDQFLEELMKAMTTPISDHYAHPCCAAVHADYPEDDDNDDSE